MNSELWNLQKIHFGPVARPRLQIESLSIPTGVTALLGKSGAGKTSLLNLLVGFEKPQQGTLSQIRPEKTQGLLLSWVPPDFGLWPHLTVQQHLQVVASENDALVAELLQEFDLESVRDQKPETLSMGERARVSVARALASQSKILVMDEPFAHVDPGRVDRYWQALRKHLLSNNSSLIFSSHSPQVVMREADQVICLDQGKILWQGDPQSLYNSPPSKSLALMMGPANWIENADSITGISEPVAGPCCLRPEQVLLEESESAGCTIEHSWFVGSHQETEVSLDGHQKIETFYHRPFIKPLPKGTRVALRVVTSCILFIGLLMLNGCRESSGDEPRLRVGKPSQFLLPAEGAMLPAARGMTFSPNEDLLILDNVGRVLRYDSAGKLLTKWWMPEYDVGRPEGVCVMQNGHIAIADTHYHRVVIFDDQCNVVRMFGESGHGEGQFIYSSAVTQDPDGFLYVAEYGGNDRVQKFTAEGEFVLMFGSVGTEEGEFQRPSGLVWHDGVIYVADAINNRIQAFSPNGKFLRVVADTKSTGLYYPYDIAIGPDGSLFVPEYGAGRISQISLEGEVIGRYGHEGRGEGQFWTPWGIAVSHSGKITIADTGNRRVVELQMK